MSANLRSRIEAELDRLALGGQAVVEHFLDGGEGLDWASFPPAIRRYIHDWLPINTERIISRARKVLERHAPADMGDGIDDPDSAMCEGCMAGPWSNCLEIRDLAESLGLGAE